MKFIRDMLSEGGKISHKRWISVTVGGAIVYGILVVIHKHPELIAEILWDAMIFVVIMSGVATVAQVASIMKGAGNIVASKTSETTESTTVSETKSETTKTE